mgnify:CR=1 FL=1
MFLAADADFRARSARVDMAKAERIPDVKEEPAGLVPVIHWRHAPATSRGPSMEIRPRPEQIMAWAKRAGLGAPPSPVLDLPPWHYGIRFHRSPSAER